MLIPVQKKFTRSSSSRFAKPSKQHTFSKPRIPYRALVIIGLSFALLYGSFLLLKYTLFVPEYTITKVDYALANVQKYDDPYLYKLISTQIKGENYRVVQWNSSTILRTIQTQYPFVQSFTVSYRGPNKVFVKLSFDEPRLVIFQGNLRYAVYNQQFFQLFSGNTLGNSGLKIELFPVVTGGALTGLFYQEPFEEFMQDLQLVYDAFPTAKYYLYLVGGQRLQIGLPNDRIVYISLPVDIHMQIQNYNYLKQYYTEFAKLREIDLGSIEMDKVIVRK